jgi:hypothetical protein
MANCLLWYNTSILKVRIFYCKKPKKYSVFFVTCTREPEYINDYGSNSKFPSTGLSSQVWVIYKQLQYIKVPEYGLKFPSTGQLLVKSTYINVLSALKKPASLNLNLNSQIKVESVKYTIFEVIWPNRKGLDTIGVIW